MSSIPGQPNADAIVLAQIEATLHSASNRLDRTNRRTRIEAAVAYESFLNSFDKLNMRDIAKRAGVSTATLYQLFPDEKTLYKAGYDFVHGLYQQVLFQVSDHPNPLYRLSEMLVRWVELWLSPSRRKVRPGRLIESDRRDGILGSNSLEYFHRVSAFMSAQLQKLKDERYLDIDISFELFEKAGGPLEALILFPYMLTGRPPSLDKSYFEYCWRMWDEFLLIHGTAHFHATRRRLNWDADLVAFKEKYK